MNEELTVNQAPEKLKMLFLIINRSKAEFYIDLLQHAGLNASFSTTAKGTAKKALLQTVGLAQTDKELILSIVTETRAHDVLEMLEEKFSTIKNGKGVAFTVPLSAMAGLSVYRFFSETT